MDIPGIGAALEDPILREKAEKEAERLREVLKKAVQAEVKDLGTLRKELRITVPGDVIGEHFTHQFDELVHDAIVPGFRKGRAPRKLVEKRFAPEVRESLKTTIVGQSFFAVTDNHKLEVLGDPLFRIQDDTGAKLVDFNEALTQLTLPESGDFSYVCEVELKPQFELPELKGIEIKMPKVEITDEMVAERILRERRNRGRYEPLPDAAADRDDLLVADVVLRVDGAEIKREENVQLGVRPTRLDGVPLLELDQTLTGARVDEKRTATGEIPNDYERPDLRGKKAEFEFTIHELKRLDPQPLEEFLRTQGFRDEDELRGFFRDELEDERDRLIERAKSEQVLDYLLTNTTLDIPADLSSRQTDRAVVRQVIELQQRGVPLSDVEARIDELRTSAKEQVTRDLKLGFILEKVAAKLDVSVTDEEVNSEIARIARLYNRRFDRVRDDLQSQGLLMQLAERIRDQKCVAQILADARQVEAA